MGVDSVWDKFGDSASEISGLFGNFISVRVALKKPTPEITEIELRRELFILSDGNSKKAIKILRYSIAGPYPKLYPLKENKIPKSQEEKKNIIPPTSLLDAVGKSIIPSIEQAAKMFSDDCDAEWDLDFLVSQSPTTFQAWILEHFTTSETIRKLREEKIPDEKILFLLDKIPNLSCEQIDAKLSTAKGEAEQGSSDFADQLVNSLLFNS